MKDFLEYIQSKKIVIYGPGQRGKAFFEKFDSQLDIVGYTKSFGTDSIEQINKIDWKIKNHNYLFVICCRDLFAVAREFIKYGYKYGEDFLSCDIVETILERKKLIVFAGQCELEIIREIFDRLDDVKNKYGTVYYMEKNYLDVPGYDQKLEAALLLDFDIKLADVFIYPANLSKERIDYYTMLLDNTKKGCIKISVPFTTFEGYWPNDVGSYYDGHSLFVRGEDGEFPFGGRSDDNIELAIKQQKGEKILDTIKESTYYSEDYILSGFQKSIHKYRILEKKANIKISDFIEANYLKRRIFIDRGHVADFVLKEYTSRILKYMNLYIDQKQLMQMKLNYYNFYRSVQPIYKSVQNFLQFEEMDSFQIWLNGKKIVVRYDEYYELLYNYMNMIHELKGLSEG